MQNTFGESTNNAMSLVIQLPLRRQKLTPAMEKEFQHYIQYMSELLEWVFQRVLDTEEADRAA